MENYALESYPRISECYGYMAKDIDFMLNTSWLACDYMTHDVLYDVQLSQKLPCTIVGTVVPEDLKVQPHGDYKPENGNLEKAMFKIRLAEPPSRYPKYQRDFLTGIYSLQNVVQSLCDSTPTSQVITEDEAGDPVGLILSHPIFKLKVSTLISK